MNEACNQPRSIATKSIQTQSPTRTFAVIPSMFLFHTSVLAAFVPVFCIDIMTKASNAFRVVSYNVLSSHLASPSHFSTLDPQHLDAAIRLPKILTKLDQEISSNDEATIFCLQEVSYQWAGKLHAFFANRGYHVITGLYGKQFNVRTTVEEWRRHD